MKGRNKALTLALMITTILVPLQRWNFKTFMLAELELG
jgi:hypothetical protein